MSQSNQSNDDAAPEYSRQGSAAWESVPGFRGPRGDFSNAGTLLCHTKEHVYARTPGRPATASQGTMGRNDGDHPRTGRWAKWAGWLGQVGPAGWNPERSVPRPHGSVPRPLENQTFRYTSPNGNAFALLRDVLKTEIFGKVYLERSVPRPLENVSRS